MFYCNIYTVY